MIRNSGYDLEAAIIGCCLVLDKDVVNEIVRLVPSDAFADELNNECYKAILRLHRKGRAIDRLLVCVELKKVLDEDKVDKSRIYGCTIAFPSAANYKSYIDELLELRGIKL